MKRKKDCPVLKGFYVNDVQIKVWCPFCQGWHYHGATEQYTKTEGEGYRSAHCSTTVFNEDGTGNSESPFNKTGYYIQVFTKDELKGCDVKGELKKRK
ncbi:hypothetical protein ES704_02869 [subsurface metagenome]|jgi:hypothetical protein